MRGTGLVSLWARGFGSALTTWKALLLFLAFNALLAAALARPIGAEIAAVTDESPTAARLLESEKATFFSHLRRARPDALGDLSALDELAAGEGVKKNLLELSGPPGTLVFLALATAFAAALFAGGFAGRFGAERDRASLAAFGADCGRFAFSSLVLGAVSIAAIVGAWRGFFVWPGTLYDPNELRYEWEAVGLSLARLLAFLLVAGLFRVVVLYARASIGLSRNGSPFTALATGAGFVAGRPVRTLALEVAFGATGLLPLLAWGALAPVWNGADTLTLVLLVAAQQLLVLFRITARAAHIGAAIAFLRLARETAGAAPTRPASPARRATPSPADKLEPVPAAPAAP